MVLTYINFQECLSILGTRGTPIRLYIEINSKERIKTTKSNNNILSWKDLKQSIIFYKIQKIYGIIQTWKVPDKTTSHDVDLIVQLFLLILLSFLSFKHALGQLPWQNCTIYFFKKTRPHKFYAAAHYTMRPHFILRGRTYFKSVRPLDIIGGRII